MADFYLAIDIAVDVDYVKNDNNSVDGDNTNNDCNDTSTKASINVLEKPFHFH